MDYENADNENADNENDIENDHYEQPNLSSESSSVSSSSNLLVNLPEQQAEDAAAAAAAATTATTAATDREPEQEEEQPRPSTTVNTTTIIATNLTNTNISTNTNTDTITTTTSSSSHTNPSSAASSTSVQLNASLLFNFQASTIATASTVQALSAPTTTATTITEHQNDTDTLNQTTDSQQQQEQQQQHEQPAHIQHTHSPTPTLHQTAPPPTPPAPQPAAPQSSLATVAVAAARIAEIEAYADVVIEEDETDDEHEQQAEAEVQPEHELVQPLVDAAQEPVAAEIIDANAIADTIDAGAIDNEDDDAADGIVASAQLLHSLAVLPSVTRNNSLPQLLRAPRSLASSSNNNNNNNNSASTSAASARRTRHFYSNNGSHFSNDMFPGAQKSSNHCSPKASSSGSRRQHHHHQQQQQQQQQQTAGNGGVDRLRMLYPNVNENETPLPRCWSPHDKCLSIGLSQSNLRVIYKGVAKQHSDAASVRTAYPIPSSCGLYYFEVRIISKGRDGYMGIGLTAQQFRMNRLPGWDKNSFGYHGDDGNSFSSSGSGQTYGPTFTTGDVIGCCVNFINNTCFYTKNGVDLGIAFRDLPVKLYPTVGLQRPGEEVDANFGQEPFKFEKIEEMMKEMRTNLLRKIDRHPHLLETPENLMNRLVSTYLVHSGYSKTAEAFNNYTEQPFDEDLQSIKTRQKIIKLIQTGKVSQAIENTLRSYPGLLESNKNLWFALKCRQFIEMINGADIEHANNKVTATTQTMPTNQTSVIQSTKAFKHSKNNTSQPQNNTANSAVIKSSDKHQQQQQELKSMIFDDNSNKCLEHDSNSMEDVEMEPCNSHSNGDACSNGNASAARNSLDAIDEEMDVDVSPSSRNYGRVIEKILDFGKELSTMGQQLEKENLMTEEERQMLEDAFSLIAYSNPWSSPLGWLLCPSRRENVSTTLNSAILESLNFERRPPLEYLVAHAAELIKIIGQHSLGEDAFITIDDVFPQN